MPAKHQAAQKRAAARPRYAGAGPAAANDIPPGATIVTTAAQLSHIVRTEVAAALDEQGSSRVAPAGAPRQLKAHELADALGVSVSTINVLRGRGLPFRRVGDSPRYELQACLDWLDTDKAQDGA